MSTPIDKASKLQPKTGSIPASSEESKTDRVVKASLSQPEAQNTKRVATYYPIPATPRKIMRRGRRNREIPLFKFRLPLVNKTIFQNVFKGDGLIQSYEQGYESLNGHFLPIIQQPKQPKSCGAGALMMFYLGYLLTERPDDANKIARQLFDENNDDFWNWYSKCQLTNGEELIKFFSTKFQADQLDIAIQRYAFRKPDSQQETFEEIKDKLVEILQSSCYSVILAITHPKLQGHWIIIDAIDEKTKEVDIRDPYSGSAYRLSFDELEENLPPDEPTVNLLFSLPLT